MPLCRAPRRRAQYYFPVTALAAVLLLVGSPAPAEAVPLPMSAKLPSPASAAPRAVYPVPAGALFVSPSGANTNAGTSAAPLKTLGNALSKVKAGQTVVMRGGTYREGASGYATGGTFYNSRLSGVTIQSYPGETVWLDGTEVVKSWTRVNDKNYTVPWSTPTLCAGAYYTRNYASQTASGPCSYSDAVGGRSSLGDPQMVFRDGVELKQVGSLSQLAGDSFFYDWSARVMHLGFNPAGRTIELTRQAQGLALFQPTNVSIKGIGFRRYATNQYGNATQGALLLNAGSNVLVENVSILNNAGTGLLSWNTRNLTLRSTVVSWNGANGLNMAGSQTKLKNDPALRDDLTIEHSRFERNNTDNYGIDCQWSCNSSGVKLAGVIGATIRWSTFNYNGGLRASGLWFDLSCTEGRIYGNKMIGNARHGLVYEVSSNGIVASNIVADNGWGVPVYGGGYGIMVGSANTRIWNNTVANNKMGVFLYDDSRSPSSSTGLDASRVGPNSVNIDFVNNVVTTNTTTSTMLLYSSGGTSTVPGNTTGEQAIRQLDSNSYAKPAGGGFVYWRTWSDKPATVHGSIADLRAAKGSAREANGYLVNAGTNPFLLNTGIGDYSLIPGSQPVGSGKTLPADISALLGVKAGTPTNRGVLTLGA